MSGVAHQGIQSNDPEAIDALKFQLENLKAEHERMKRINAYHRKNKTLEGCPDLTENQAKELQESMDKWIYHIPFPSYSLQSSNAKMKRIQERIESLEKAKEKGNAEQEYDGFKYIENSEAIRKQINSRKINTLNKMTFIMNDIKLSNLTKSETLKKHNISKSTYYRMLKHL